jgi:hypothetical protein
LHEANTQRNEKYGEEHYCVDKIVFLQLIYKYTMELGMGIGIGIGRKEKGRKENNQWSQMTAVIKVLLLSFSLFYFCLLNKNKRDISI